MLDKHSRYCDPCRICCVHYSFESDVNISKIWLQYRFFRIFKRKQHRWKHWIPARHSFRLNTSLQRFWLKNKSHVIDVQQRTITTQNQSDQSSLIVDLDLFSNGIFVFVNARTRLITTLFMKREIVISPFKQPIEESLNVAVQPVSNVLKVLLGQQAS